MGVEENDDKPINLLEVQPEIPEQEPIEEVFSQEREDIRPIEPSTNQKINKGLRKLQNSKKI